MTPVEQWFGDAFSSFSAEIQWLHKVGGALEGDVEIRLGDGRISRWMGKQLAVKLGILSRKEARHQKGNVYPSVPMRVDIWHDESRLFWSRQFNKQQKFISTFMPVGIFRKGLGSSNASDTTHNKSPDKIHSGYWLEYSKPFKLKLDVQIINGGWHWKLLDTYWHGIPIPNFIAPSTQAYKRMENECYRFSVDISLPLLGSVLSYSGLLKKL